MKKSLKRFFMLAMLLCIFLAVGCTKDEESTPAEVTIDITADKTTVQKGDVINFAVVVTGTENQSYTWSISDMSLITVDISLKGTVLKNVQTKTDVTITVTSNADTTKSDTVVITVEPFGSASVVVPTLELTADKENVVKDDVITLSVVVENADDNAYTLTASHPEYIVFDNNIATVIKEPERLDVAVTITATLTSNPTVKDSVTVIVKAPIVKGQVGELTTEMLQAVGTASITVTGTLTDYYEDFKNASKNSQQSYEMEVKMEQDAWSGTWYPIGNPEGALTNVYRKGEKNGVEDQYGNIGHTFLESYIDKNNTVQHKEQMDYMSIPVVWEAQHLWNHLGNLDITKFTYDAINGVYAYNGNTEADLYLLTYLSYCLTPLLADTLVELYLIVEDGKVTKLLGQTEQILEYGSSATDVNARSYTRIELTFSNVGTTTVPNPQPYAAPQNANVLETAINNMAALTNYTFQVKDVTTSAPSTDEGDYSIEGQSRVVTTQSTSTSRKVANYTTSVGTVGRVGYVTQDAILFEDTGKYSYTMDGNSYFIEYSGLKQNEDATYDEFAYSTDLKTLAGTKLVYGNIFDAMPNFDFSANVFEYKKQETIDGVTYYTFQLREDAITRDIAMEISAYNYADDAEASTRTKLTIIVDSNGYIVQTVYPYNLVSGTYLGNCTTTYGNFNTTTLPEGTFDGYVPREVGESWSDYMMKYYHPGFSTQDPYVEATADTVIAEIFASDASLLPAPSVFIKLFGDNISGPFYDWKEIATDADGNPVNRAHFSITTHASKYDENGNLNQDAFNEYANVIISELAQYGFVIDHANTQMNHRSLRYICLINGDVQIVIENNGTKYFWIKFYVTGDWTLN